MFLDITNVCDTVTYKNVSKCLKRLTQSVLRKTVCDSPKKPKKQKADTNRCLHPLFYVL